MDIRSMQTNIFDPPKPQEGSAARRETPPPQSNAARGPSWAAVEIKSRLLNDTFILCRSEYLASARERWPGLTIYEFPAEAHRLLAVLEENGPEALKLVHLVKRSCDGTMVPSTDLEVRELEFRIKAQGERDGKKADRDRDGTVERDRGD